MTPGTRFTDIYRDLQAKLLPDNDLDQELDDSNSFLSIAINSAVLEHSEVDETFSSYILQPDPMGDSSQYAPYRHPSGTEMESFKNDDSDTASPAAAELLFAGPKSGGHSHADMKREVEHGSIMTNSPGDNFTSHYTTKSAFVEEVIDAEVENLRVGNIESGHQAANPPCDSLVTPAHYDQHLSASPLQEGTGPGDLAGYRASPSNSCDDGYKQYSHASQLTEEYYRSDQQQQQQAPTYLSKDIPTSAASLVVGDYDSDQNKCMDSLPDGSFNQELFKNQQLGRDELILYREDSGARNTAYIFPRDNSVVYHNELDAYRNLCCPQQPYENYNSKSLADVRADYDTYKYDPVGGSMDLKPASSSGGNHAGGPTSEDQGERHPEKLERLNSRSDFDLTEYQILEQVINEQRLSERSLSTATKRYDPTYRALAEAFKQTEPDMSGSGGPLGADMFPYKADTCQSAKWERAEQNQANKWDRVDGM